MARQGIVVKSFPYAADGMNTEILAVDREYPFVDAHFYGLVKAGYVKPNENDDAEAAAKAALDGRLIAAFDLKLAATSDEELKAMIARSGAPWSGNLVHAEMVAAAKEQLVREMEGVEPIFGVDPAPGVTEQPLSSSGAPLRPFVPAAVAAAQADQAGEEADKTADSAPTGLKASHRGGGSYSVLDTDGKEVAEKLSKAEAEAFNGLDSDGKAEFLAKRAKKD